MTSKDLAPREDGDGGDGGIAGGKTRRRKAKLRERDDEPDRGAAGDAVAEDAGRRIGRGHRRRDDGELDPLYDTLTRLERADARAASSPSPRGGGRSVGGRDDVARSRAARSQYGMGNRLIEVRILMQRTLQQHAASALHALEDDARGDSTGVRKKRRGKGSGDDDLDESEDIRGNDSDVDSGSGSDDDEDGEGSSVMKDRNIVEDCRRADALLRQLRTSLLSARDSALPALLASARLKGGDDATTAGDDEDPDAIEERMRSDHKRCREAWRAVLDRRHRDVQLRSGLATMGSSSSSRDKFTVVNQGFWDQVEATLAHERLHRLDGGEDGDDADGGGDASSSAPKPVYDDARSYQHMLRDFIERGSRGGSVGDGGTAAEQQLRALRNSNKKRKAHVDRRASKGRKIRYGAGLHPKLEGFTFPVPRGSTVGNGISGGTMQSMMIDEDDWFKSLFGGAASQRGENGRKVV